MHDGVVDAYEGGYAAFVLAKAERQRQAAASEIRRQNLVRKELAWLRRGPPARTSKPKFRIDAANALIEDVPPPRDRLELQRFASQRLGKDVIDVEDVDLVRGERMLLHHATWRLGPGDRVGIVGVERRRQDLGAGPGRRRPRAGGRPREARPDGRDAAPDPARRRARPREPGAGLRRVDPAGHQDRRRRGHGQLDARAVRLHRRPAHRRGSATCPVASGAASSCSGCCCSSRTCCSSTSPPTTSTSRP